MSNELYHYGRSKKDGAPGVGTGNWKRKGISFSGDERYKKGTTWYRTTKTKDEKFNGQTYASTSKKLYLGSEFVEDPYNTYRDTYKTTREIVIAGKETINRILKEIGNQPLEDNTSNDAMWNRVLKMSPEELEEYKKTYTPQDFLLRSGYSVKYGLYDEKRANAFVEELRKRGYDGLKDPADYVVGMGKSRPTIFVNDVLNKVSSIPISELDK